MRGLKHNVIEINDTDNANIEKIIVFLKPQAEKVSVMTTRKEANLLLKQLDVKKVKEKPFKASNLLWFLAAAILIVLLLVFFL